MEKLLRYLFVKTISDNVENISETNGTLTEISSVKYHKFGSYQFDYDKPTISVNTVKCDWRNTALSVTITVADTGGSGLATTNSYQYYLSTSDTKLEGGSWKNYTSGTADRKSVV